MKHKFDLSLQDPLVTPTLLGMNLKTQLRLYLEKKDMSATQLARRSGVSKQVLSTWLSGGSPRKIEQLKKVADVLGVTVDHLCFGNSSTTKEDAANLETILGNDWISGIFEIKLRRIKK